MKNDNGISEVTKQMIEWASACTGKCESCMLDAYHASQSECLKMFSKALLSERAEREAMQDMWKDAPTNASFSEVLYYEKLMNGMKSVEPIKFSEIYTRTPPKNQSEADK
jgi:hypothetical protein